MNTFFARSVLISVAVASSVHAGYREPANGNAADYQVMRAPDGIAYPDFTYAGIEGGIPDVRDGDVKVFDVTTYGASPADDGKDDTAAIQAAIDAALANKSGIVFLPEGHYSVRGADKKAPLRVNTNGTADAARNVVVRGAGRGRTILFLAESSPDTSAIEFSGPGKSWQTPGLARDAKRGDMFIYANVSDAKLFTKGMKLGIVANAANEPQWYWGKAYVTRKPDEVLPYYSPWARMANEVVSIAEEGALIKLQLRQPVRTDLKSGSGDYSFPGGKIEQRNHTDLIPRRFIERCGLEDLTLRFSDQATAAGNPTNKGCNGVSFKNAWECWMKGVEIVRPGRFPIDAQDVKFLHFYDCQFREIEHRFEGGGTGYGGWYDWTGNYFVEDCMMDRVQMQDMRHAPVLQGHSMGNVIRRCEFYAGKHDYHSGPTAETLVETSLHDLRGGGGEAFRSPQLPGDLHGHPGPRNVTFNNEYFTLKQGLYVGGLNLDWVFAYNRVFAAAGPKVKPDNYPPAMIVFFDWIDGLDFIGNVFISPNISDAPAILYLPGYEPFSGWREAQYFNSEQLNQSRNIRFTGNAFYGWDAEKIFADPGYPSPVSARRNSFDRANPPHNSDVMQVNQIDASLPHRDDAELAKWPDVPSWPVTKPFAESLYEWQYKQKYGVAPWEGPKPDAGPWRLPVAAEKNVNLPNTELAFVPRLQEQILIDGKIDAVWERVEMTFAPDSTPQRAAITKYAGKPLDPKDLSGAFKAYWNDTGLHLLVTATDESLIGDSGSMWWEDDAVEVYLDANNAHADSYDDDDNQIAFLPTRKEAVHQKGPGLKPVTADYIVTETGYAIEMHIPWQSIGFGGLTGVKFDGAGQRIGFNITLLDDDKGSRRDSRLSWVNDYDAKGNDLSHACPRLLGTLELAGNASPQP